MTKFELVEKDLNKIDGLVLYNMNPQLFDIRLTGYDGSRFSGTRKQWDQYIQQLTCALCGVPGGDCNCPL